MANFSSWAKILLGLALIGFAKSAPCDGSNQFSFIDRIPLPRNPGPLIGMPNPCGTPFGAVCGCGSSTYSQGAVIGIAQECCDNTPKLWGYQMDGFTFPSNEIQSPSSMSFDTEIQDSVPSYGWTFVEKPKVHIQPVIVDNPVAKISQPLSATIDDPIPQYRYGVGYGTSFTGLTTSVDRVLVPSVVVPSPTVELEPIYTPPPCGCQTSLGLSGGSSCGNSIGLSGASKCGNSRFPGPSSFGHSLGFSGTSSFGFSGPSSFGNSIGMLGLSGSKRLCEHSGACGCA